MYQSLGPEHPLFYDQGSDLIYDAESFARALSIVFTNQALKPGEMLSQGIIIFDQTVDITLHNAASNRLHLGFLSGLAFKMLDAYSLQNCSSTDKATTWDAYIASGL